MLHTAGGQRLLVDTVRWHARPTEEEVSLLERSVGSVLDVGCGPGRHVLALVAAGRTALGIDVSPVAVATAIQRGARVMQASVFGLVPDAGSWGTALLLDGNIGIGGHPRNLLRRVAGLLRPGGHVLVEVEGPELMGRRLRVRVEHAGKRTQWFPWATVAVLELGELARASGFAVTEVWQANGRWFGDLYLVETSRDQPNRYWA
ncbi:MAG: class I SAM-dependent methyltransferase [Actinomycetota bacterium]|nr:class I SAM-dependent methyltransferase [Actinomycetota bacterium]